MGGKRTFRRPAICCDLPVIKSIGRSIFDPVWAEKVHAGHTTEVMHVLRGQVRVETKAYTIVGRAGDTIYTPANMLHRDVFPTNTVFEVFLVHLAWAGEKDMLKKFSPVQLAGMSKTVRRRVAEDFHQLYHDFTSGLPYTRELISLRLLQIIYTMCREAAGTSDPDNENLSKARRIQIMTQARQYIEDNFAKPVSLDDIAAMLDISSYYLSRVFSEESGFTLSNYLTSVRMHQADQLLRDPRRNIAQVAHAVGFKDSHYFARVFKARYGQSPKTYRAQAILETEQK